MSSPDGILAFTNMPYVTDAGTARGENFVNTGTAGTLDGVTIVNGHEYAETVRDQYPAGGWTDIVGNENGDKCAWISTGHGAAQNIALTTGTFAVQSTWANDFNSGTGGCEVTHPVVQDAVAGIAHSSQLTSWFSTSDALQHTAYVGTDGHIYELYMPVGQQPWHGDTVG